MLWFRKSPEPEPLHGLDPWTLACAVGTSNGSLAGHSQLAGLSFDQWLEQRSLHHLARSLSEYAQTNSSKSYYEVLKDERLIRGLHPFSARPYASASQIKVVFLDFDGVLVPRHLANKKEADPQCVRCLNQIIASPEVRIVISSAWRMDYNLYSLRYCLRDWGVDSDSVIDATPGIPGNHIRGVEIQSWLDEREQRFGDVSQFVILDDLSDMAHLLPHLVQSSLDIGLTHEHVALAQNILRG